MKFLKTIVLLLVLLLPLSASAQFYVTGDDPGRLKWNFIDTESYRADFALHLLQCVHQLAALLVGQGAGGIHHACKLHEPFAINLICLRDIISAGRARILRSAVNGS